MILLFSLGICLRFRSTNELLADTADAYMREFWTVKRRYKTLHIKHIHLQGDMNNNKMERLNGEFRDREKVVRGIKKKDSVIIDGYQLYHNYSSYYQLFDLT